jgi:hypothetical protein
VWRYGLDSVAAWRLGVECGGPVQVACAGVQFDASPGEQDERRPTDRRRLQRQRSIEFSAFLSQTPPAKVGAKGRAICANPVRKYVISDFHAASSSSPPLQNTPHLVHIVMQQMQPLPGPPSGLSRGPFSSIPSTEPPGVYLVTSTKLPPLSVPVRLEQGK